MVARTPPRLRKVPPPLNPQLIRETLTKVDRCMARLQELQYTVAGGRKVVSGVSLSPRSTRAYLRTSLRCKQESLRIKSCGGMKSPVGKFSATLAGDEWRRMSLPAMLVGETVSEILQATQFAREILSAASGKADKKQLLPDDPKTPMARRKGLRTPLENTELHSRRKREKQNKSRESHSPSLQKARSRINFKVSPPKQREISERDNGRYLANRVSPRHKPWARKTVLFPNPLFTSSPSKQNQQQKFCKTRSPVIVNKRRQTTSPHKFLIKSPHSASKFQVKIKSPPKIPVSPPKKHSVSQFHVKIRSPPRVSVSPPMRRSSKDVGSSTNASKLRRSFSSSKLRQSFSPSRIASRLMSPLKGRKSMQKSSCDGLIAFSGLKQRPVLTPVSTFSSRRIP